VRILRDCPGNEKREVLLNSVYAYQLRHDRTGRIVDKVETVKGKAVKWTYRYDKKGRLHEAHLDNRLVCRCLYDKQGRRSQDSFPATHGSEVRNYGYTVDNRLQQAGNNGYTHDANGFRTIWNHKGKYTTYEYATDYRLLKAEQENDGIIFTYDHDENGQRKTKYRNNTPVEAYQWLDAIRLAGFHDGETGYSFVYNGDERTPYALKGEDGPVAYLHYDQIGSLRAVADESGNVIKEILYDPFGGVIRDTNPDLRIPIGFAGGLHDRDLGFVRFGWRDYDTFTSRWTAPDPMGDTGGDPDWYGYCLDDPVNGVDPLGLFRFGKRPLSFIPDNWHAISMDRSYADKFNFEPKHEQGFYEDGSGRNIGYGKSGPMEEEDITKYQLEDKQYDDQRMRRAEDSTTPGEYNALGIGGKKNNCQDYADKLRDRYELLQRGDRMR